MFFQQLMRKRGNDIEVFCPPNCLLVLYCPFVYKKYISKTLEKIFAEETVSVHIFVEILSCQEQ